MISLEGTVEPVEIVEINPDFQHVFYIHPESSEKHWLHEEGGIFNTEQQIHDSERAYVEEVAVDYSHWDYRTEFVIYKQTWPKECYFGEVKGSIIDTWIGVGEVEELKRRARELDYTQIVEE